MANQTQNPMTDMFQQINDNFDRTLKAGTEFQEQTSSFWKSFFEQGGDNFRQQFDNASNDMLPFGKANVERFQQMFDAQAHRTVELMNESFELGKANSPAGACQEMTKLWQRSFDSMRTSNEMFAKANAEMFEQFSKFACGAGHGREQGKASTKPVK